MDKHEAALKAMAGAHGRVEQARAALAAAREGFKYTQMDWWGDVGDYLGSATRPFSPHYKELRAALKAAEEALVRAEVACVELAKATKPAP